MITDAANNYSDALLAKGKEYAELAKSSAVQYAINDDKGYQANYRKYDELSEVFYKLHGEACQFMHAIEAEMRTRLQTEASSTSSKT